MGSERYTSVYLDAETRDKLQRLSAAYGVSKSHTVRRLINNAEFDELERISELVAELASILNISASGRSLRS